VSEDDQAPTLKEDSRVHEVMKSFDFMSEEEQGDDPRLVQEWIDDLQPIPAVPEDAVKETDLRAWDDKMRQYNIEAVREVLEKACHDATLSPRYRTRV
jgi:hypothetical protein